MKVARTVLRALERKVTLKMSTRSSLTLFRGKRTPTVERGETDFNTLGMWFRVYFDLGVREQEHRGMVKSAGAAG